MLYSSGYVMNEWEKTEVVPTQTAVVPTQTAVVLTKTAVAATQIAAVPTQTAEVPKQLHPEGLHDRQTSLNIFHTWRRPDNKESIFKVVSRSF